MGGSTSALFASKTKSGSGTSNCSPPPSPCPACKQIHWLADCKHPDKEKEKKQVEIAAAKKARKDAAKKAKEKEGASAHLADANTSNWVGWIDDTTLWTWSKDVESAIAQANSLLARLPAWAESHKSEVEASKSLAIVFSTRRNLPPSSLLPPISLNGITIPFAKSITALGAELDKKLTFKAHVNSAASKGLVALGGIAMLACAAKGIAPRLLRTLVGACVNTKTDYASTLWFKPTASVKMVKKLKRVQKVAVKMVSGGLKLAVLSVLEVESNILPIRLCLQHRTLKVALRTISLPPSHPLYLQVSAVCSALPSRHRSPLHLLLHSSPLLLPPSLVVETIHPFPFLHETTSCLPSPSPTRKRKH
jgi:hypothetical protein